jgi:hypothetical protein
VTPDQIDRIVPGDVEAQLVLRVKEINAHKTYKSTTALSAASVTKSLKVTRLGSPEVILD